MEPAIELGGRRIGATHRPLVIAEIGINHEGSCGRPVILREAGDVSFTTLLATRPAAFGAGQALAAKCGDSSDGHRPV